MMIVLAGYFTSCEKFMDINDDPNNPSDAAIIDLMPAAQLGIAFGLSNMLNRVAEDAVQHLVIQRFDGWAVEPSDLSNAWRFSLYAGGLKDLETIIEKAAVEESWHYVGVSKLLKAYAFSVMVDLWDDVPYSQALKEEFAYPEFDDGAAIYDALVSLIEFLVNRKKVEDQGNYGFSRLGGTLFYCWPMFIFFFTPPAYYGQYATDLAEIISANIILYTTSICTILIERQFEAVRISKELRVAIVVISVVLISLFVIYTYRLPWFDLFAIPPGWE